MKQDATGHRFEVRVYYEDTDFSGVVYHANYLRFLERGRTEMLRSLGLDQSALHGGSTPLAFVVRHMTLDFRGPAQMDDRLTVESVVAAIGGASITLNQRVLRDDTELLAAVVRIGVVSRGRAHRLPREMAAQLATSLHRSEDAGK